MVSDKVAVTCSLTGLLTDPKKHPVPVTPEEMASSAKEAYDAGASIMHVHYRSQEPGMGHMPTWDPDVAGAIVDAIRESCPGVLICSTTGVMGDDLSGPNGVLERTRPELAAMNAGSLNYLKLRSNGTWAWPPLLFGNPVSKIEQTIAKFNELDVVPECECFDTGIVRSVKLFVEAGMLEAPPHVSLVMGVASGMPAKATWLPLLIDEMLPGTHWQSILIGREEIWETHVKTAELGGHLRTGVEDTFYLPSGEKTSGNGQLIEELVKIARDVGREPMTPAEARELFTKS